jgi:hypothetical protein
MKHLNKQYNMATLHTKNIKLPAPKWFKVTKDITGVLLDATMAILLVLGYTNESTLMLLIRIAQSNLMKILDVFLADTATEIENETP